VAHQSLDATFLVSTRCVSSENGPIAIASSAPVLFVAMGSYGGMAIVLVSHDRNMQEGGAGGELVFS
jgi:hypothetical protein